MCKVPFWYWWHDCLLVAHSFDVHSARHQVSGSEFSAAFFHNPTVLYVFCGTLDLLDQHVAGVEIEFCTFPVLLYQLQVTIGPCLDQHAHVLPSFG